MCLVISATVQCTKDGQFVLVIARDATVPEIDLDSISIVESTDGPCKAVDRNVDFAIYQFPVTACGTRTKVCWLILRIFFLMV